MQWIKDHYGAEVIAFTADIGQGEEVQEAKEKALQTGASQAYALDLQKEFVEAFVFPVLRAGAIYEGYYLLGTSFARPLIAREMVKIAEREGADAVAHGATGKGNDQVRFELSAYALKPDIKVIAPWREWDLKGREDCIRYAQERGISVPVTKEKPYSTDANLYHISYEGGILEDPWAAPPADMWQLTADPESAPNEPESVTVEFEQGNPGRAERRKAPPGRALETRQRTRWQTRRRARRHRGEPFRGDEITRLLRDTRGHAAVSRAQGSRTAHAGQAGAATARRTGAQVRRDGLQRLLVRA